MTELYFLDETFRITDGPFEDMTSVVFSERYFDTGTFTIHFPREMAGRASGAVYVRSGVNPSGQIFCGRIEYLHADSDGDCEMGGHLLECLMDDRILTGGPWSGTASDAILSAVRDNLRDSPVKIGETHASLPDQVTLTADWESLSVWMHRILRPYGASFRVIPGTDGTPELSIVRGRTLDNVIFSASFGNIFSIESKRNTASMKNAVYVEGSDGTVVFADLSGGQNLREMHKKASDLSPGKFADEEAYRQALLRRGYEILAGCGEKFQVSAEIDSGALPVYGRDNRLGDVCPVVDEELGVSLPLRLTQVDWVSENGTTSVYPVFGE